MLTRRELIAGLTGAGIVVGTGAAVRWFKSMPGRHQSLVVNDVHSQLNETAVKMIEHPRSLEDLIGIVKRAARSGDKLCIAGSRHAMGGQQFAKDAVLIDTRSMAQIIDFDEETGIVEVEAGIEWPALVNQLLARQNNSSSAWSISSKQTGADKLTLGGAFSANAHGRTLTQGPIIKTIDSLLLVNAAGEIVKCSRDENPELFSLVIGGYGMFGVVHSIRLQLERRHKIMRIVEVIPSQRLIERFEDRIEEGYTHGDFQFVTDESEADFLKRGVFSCYIPVPEDTPIPKNQDKITPEVWEELVYLGHVEKARAFKLYADYYLKTTGQAYWSDLAQIGGYFENYHKRIDDRMDAESHATEMITEIYIPRARLEDFLDDAAIVLRERGSSTIYGTIRLIEKDNESFLAWAKLDYACVIFNLHVVHTEEGLEQAIGSFRALIDLSINRAGSFYLTYHRWATKAQVLACYPNFPEFLQKKLEYDSGELFQSEWYRHYKQLLGTQ
jgi:FAD/FMN-containing dehydrogenase